MRPFLSTILSALALVTAGCVTDNDRPPASPSDPVVAGDVADPAGPSGPSASKVDPGGPASGPDPQPVITPFSYSGTTSTGACVNPAWSGVCNGSPGKNVFKKLEAPGRPQTLVVTPTWDARTPLTETLYFSLLVDGGEGYRLDPENSEEATSGTRIEWTLTDPDAGYALLVGHWVGYWDWETGTAGVELPQDFTVDGHVVSIDE